MTGNAQYSMGPASPPGTVAGALPRHCSICGDPSDYHCGDLGCMGSWPVRECGCTLTAAQVERVSADV